MVRATSHDPPALQCYAGFNVKMYTEESVFLRRRRRLMIMRLLEEDVKLNCAYALQKITKTKSKFLLKAKPTKQIYKPMDTRSCGADETHLLLHRAQLFM